MYLYVNQVFWKFQTTGRVCSMHIRGATINFSLAIPKVRRSFKGEGFASKIPNLESIDKTADLPMTVTLLI